MRSSVPEALGVIERCLAGVGQLTVLSSGSEALTVRDAVLELYNLFFRPSTHTINRQTNK